MAAYQRSSHLVKTAVSSIVTTAERLWHKPSEQPMRLQKTASEKVFAKEISTQQRVFELKKILEKFKRKPSYFLFGFGNGATADFSNSPDLTMALVYGTRINHVHSIHLLPLAIMHRQGFLGLAVFFFLCFTIITALWKTRRDLVASVETRCIVEILFLNFVSMLIGSLFSAPHIFTNVTVGFGLGILMIMLNFDKQPILRTNLTNHV